MEKITESSDHDLNPEETTSQTVIPTAALDKSVKTALNVKKALALPIIERRNWLIHAHYVRKEYVTCKSLIKEQLKESKGQCEYAIYIQAMILRFEGEIQSSLELFQACHLLNPHNPVNLKQVARNLVLLGKHKSAIECYNKAAQLSEKDWSICHCLGVCHEFLKETDQAIQHYVEALSRNKHVITYEALYQIYLEIGETDKAMDILKKGVEFAPENIDLLTSLGLLYLQKDDFHRAFELLGQVLTYDPENFKAILAVSSLMQRHDDFDVALNKYRIASRTAPDSSTVWNNVGMCYYGKKKTVPAISCLKRAHYYSPFDWKILYNLSLIHLTTQQYASAFQFASSAIALKQDHGPLFGLLAIALSHLEQPENAEKAYEEAMKLSPDDLYLLLNYCIFLHNSAKNHHAAKLMTTILTTHSQEELSSNDREAADMCKKLTAALHLGDKVVADREAMQQSKPEPANQEPTDQDPTNQEPTDQDPTNQEPTDQDPTNQEPSTPESTNQEPRKSRKKSKSRGSKTSADDEGVAVRISRQDVNKEDDHSAPSASSGIVQVRPRQALPPLLPPMVRSGNSKSSRKPHRKDVLEVLHSEEALP